ncbi:MAG TPA: pilus assembly protein TadG-related protein [Stellaceae bacterium]|jgi:Flp pilus assembly protein TadG
MMTLTKLLRRVLRDKRGATAILTALMVPLFCGVGALCVDGAHIAQTERALQASTDAAALAGASKINCCAAAPGTATTVATQYSAGTGDLNALSGATVTMMSGFPQLKCLQSTGFTCSGPDSANAIAVKQQAVVPTIFAKMIGVESVTITATSTAGQQGGGNLPVDVMFVLDTTQSMTDSDTNCSVSHATRMTCALTGIQSVLKTLKPSVDYAGLMVFPGLKNASQAQYDYDCVSSPSPQIVSYKSSPVYQVLGLVNDYRTSDSATSLNPSSNLAKAAQEPGCSVGVQAVGGVGTFYADAIKAAQSALATNGHPGTQKVIILLGDGDASASSSNMPTGEATNQCHQAITAANAATSAGMWVYSIAYGASTSSTGSCSTDSPHISACSTLQQIASNSTMFYSDTEGVSGGCASSNSSVSELVAIFNSIGESLSGPRLLLDTTS